MESILHKCRASDSEDSIFVEYEHLIEYHEEYAEKDARYGQWMDHVDLVISTSRNGLKSLVQNDSPVYPLYPEGFEHTSIWRERTSDLPLLVLTEPYYESAIVREGWYQIAKENGLEFHIFSPSKKSLSLPDYTYMIFWWCPDRFEPNFDVLMGHADWSEVRRKFNYPELEYQDGSQENDEK